MKRRTLPKNFLAITVAAGLLLAACGTKEALAPDTSPTLALPSSPAATPPTVSTVISAKQSATISVPSTTIPTPTTVPTTTTLLTGRYNTLSSAQALLVSKGYADSRNDSGANAYDQRTWNASGRLHALIDYSVPCGDCKSQHVFFFANGQYLGTDTAESSLSITFDSATSDTVTVRYTLYAATDPMCCPTGGSQSVRYQLQGTTLVPLDTIPPVAGSDERPGR